jgi:hypothetical protein
MEQMQVLHTNVVICSDKFKSQ